VRTGSATLRLPYPTVRRRVAEPVRTTYTPVARVVGSASLATPKVRGEARARAASQGREPPELCTSPALTLPARRTTIGGLLPLDEHLTTCAFL